MTKEKQSKKKEGFQMGPFDLDDLARHAEEFDGAIWEGGFRESCIWYGLGKPLEEGVRETKHETLSGSGFIASMPQIIATMTQVSDPSVPFRSNGMGYIRQPIVGLSEENVGIDRKGTLVGRGKEIVVYVHGGGILTPERISEAFNESTDINLLTPGGNVHHADKNQHLYENEGNVPYSNKEFGDLLKGVLPCGKHIELYSVDDVEKGKVPDPFGNYGVWLPGETAKSLESRKFPEKKWLEHPLVLSRAGSPEYLEKFFEVCERNDILGSYNQLENLDFKKDQGSFICLDKSNGLRGGQGILFDGRFVGITRGT